MMPTAAINFGNRQASGDQALAGAPGLAYNVVVDGAGAIRRRPGIVLWEQFPEISIDTFSFAPDIYFPQYGIIVDGTFSNFDVRALTAYEGGLVWMLGVYIVGGVLYRGDIYHLEEDGTFNSIATAVPGARRPRFAETQHRLHVTAGGSAEQGWGYYLDRTNTTVTPWDSMSPWLQFGGTSGDGPYATQIAALAQRIFVNDTFDVAGRNTIRYTGTGATGNLSLGALGFTSAEAKPDAVVALRENSNELFAFGTRSLQVFVPDPNVILAPQRTVNRGCAAADSIITADEEFALLDEQRQIIVTDGRRIEVVSDPIAATLDGIETVDDCYGFRVNTDQFDLLNFQFPTDERLFSYQKGSGWSQWSTWDVDLGHGPVDIKSHYYWPERNLHLVGLSNGQIAQLSTTAYTDLGDPIVAEVTTGFINHDTDAVKFTDALHLTFKRGQTASTEPLVFLSWRDDLGAFGDPIQIGLGTTGDYVSTVTLRTLGGYRRRQWKLLFSADAELVLASVTEDYSIGGS